MYRSGSSNYNSRARYGKGSYNTSSYGKSNILNANFEGANLIGATWTNGEICGPDSIGVCNK